MAHSSALNMEVDVSHTVVSGKALDWVRASPYLDFNLDFFAE